MVAEIIEVERNHILKSQISQSKKKKELGQIPIRWKQSNIGNFIQFQLVFLFYSNCNGNLLESGIEEKSMSLFMSYQMYLAAFLS